MPTAPLFILTVLCLLVAASEWLVHRTALRHLGTALLVIALTAIVANLGLLPTGSTDERPVPAYDAVFAYIAPLALFWLLLPVNLRDVLRAGLPMIGLFLIGAVGTTIGVTAGLWLIDARATIGPLYYALGGMFVGTYTGGGVNFNALALAYDVVREGVLYGGTVAVDNVMTAVWMAATIALPRVLAPLWPARRISPAGPTAQAAPENPPPGVLAPEHADVERVAPIDLGILLALGFAAVWISGLAADGLAAWGVTIPSIVLVSLLALIAAQVPALARLKGTRVLGMFAVYLFLAVIGAFCDFAALRELGRLGLALFGLALTTVLIHGLITFAAARAMRIELDIAAVASQANIGGPPSALALARSLGRDDLVLPAVLVGALGYALGTFLGFGAAAYLFPLLP